MWSSPLWEILNHKEWLKRQEKLWNSRKLMRKFHWIKKKFLLLKLRVRIKEKKRRLKEQMLIILQTIWKEYKINNNRVETITFKRCLLQLNQLNKFLKQMQFEYRNYAENQSISKCILNNNGRYFTKISSNKLIKYDDKYCL